MSFLRWINGMNKGISTSEISENQLCGEERYYGFENFGNTCYCNSVLQVLYFCKPFRNCVVCYNFPESACQLAAMTEQLDLSCLHSSRTSALESHSYKDQTDQDSKTTGESPYKGTATVELFNLQNHSTLAMNTHSSTASVNTPTSALTPSSAQPSIPSSAASVAQSGTSASVPTGTHNAVSGVPQPSGTVTSERGIWTGTRIASVVKKLPYSENAQNSILHAMQELFVAISTQKKRTGVFSPRYFISKLKEENELFNNTMQQDAHEMFNYLLNAIAEILLNQKTEMVDAFKTLHLPILPNSKVKEQTAPTWIHALFEGQLTNETKCLNCESITNRVESFLDLSIDIDQHSSISSCLRNFSSSEVLYGKNKFFCDTCNSLQEAEKRMKIKRLPNVLAVHLKRFKFQEQLGRYSKLSYQVSFPLELRLFNTADGAENADRLYQLHGVVVHIGSSPQSGHYVALIKSENQWMLFDDDDVRIIEEADLFQYFGDSNLFGTGYFYLFTAVDFDSNQVLKTIMPETWISQTEKTSTHSTSNDEHSQPINTHALATEVKDPNIPVQVHILASQELVKDEDSTHGSIDQHTDLPGELTKHGNADLHLFNQALQTQLMNQAELQQQLSTRTTSSGHVVKEDTFPSVPHNSTLAWTGKKLGLGSFIGGSMQGKRPSLPALHMEVPVREDITKGPMTADVVDQSAFQQGVGSSSSLGGKTKDNNSSGTWPSWLPSIRKDKGANSKANTTGSTNNL
ncbi:hypothetical protein BDV3_002622 [Batrachochytrium dendrobatidis]|uniref:Ubiquitin carboxyl-terminal hydrolase n=2 Tax=Batrachochytrium dendrobatidis (strain JEL423) TaxID=403673 RepID=A0A177WVS5_BATDL|nr:hypothetical protein BDEG_27327 [Batrachochytrium dendrobatidis JEL423]